jgi:ornithine carbamoyltransferase
VNSLKDRDFLTLRDFSREELQYLIDLSIRLKKEKKDGVYRERLKRMNAALIFEKPSTRTRCSFTVACADEGAHPEYLNRGDIQLGGKESVADTARVLSRMFDIIEFRGFAHRTIEELAEYSSVPVINGLTDDEHPIQILADFMTIQERFGRLLGLKLVYAGDGRNNMANSLMLGCAKMGMDYVCAAPPELSPDSALTAECVKYAGESGGSVRVERFPREAVKGADVVYTDVWASMGEEAKAAERLTLLSPYQVNADLMRLAGEAAVFLHCLPAVKGKEVTEEVFEAPYSLVFDEAENRVHTAKAVMVALKGKDL